MTHQNSLNNKLPLSEKLGYALGDAASNLVWRGALAYLAIFYTDVFGISAVAASLLLLLVRLSDGLTDILMGMIADRTASKYGKFRPWLLWASPFLALFMVLSFTTPDLSDTGKLIWAYLTYIGLTLAYTVVNVPYSALMGVMTDNHRERNVLSGWRFAGAFMGGALMTGFLPGLVAWLGQGNQQQGYQYAMFLFAGILLIMLLITFWTTKERVQAVIQPRQSFSSELSDFTKNLPFIILPLLAVTLFFYYRNWVTGVIFVVIISLTVWICRRLIAKPEQSLSPTQRDLVDLITNKPWWILLAIGFLFMMFNGIKQGAIVYYFKYYLNNELLAGAYFIALLITSMIAALIAGYLSRRFGKKNLLVASLVLGALSTGAIYFVPRGESLWLFIIGCFSEIFAAFMPVLFFSMLGDVADYSEWKTGRRATGLFYSAGTFINKTGGGFAGALILLVLASWGYDGMKPETAEQALPAIQLLMSWIPAAFALLGAAVMMLYPISDQKLESMTQELRSKRAAATA